MTLGIGSQALMIHIFHGFLVYVNAGTVVRVFFVNPGGPFLQTLEQPLVMKVVSGAGS